MANEPRYWSDFKAARPLWGRGVVVCSGVGPALACPWCKSVESLDEEGAIPVHRQGATPPVGPRHRE